MERVSAAVNAALKEDLIRFAQTDCTSLSDVVRRALTEYAVGRDLLVSAALQARWDALYAQELARAFEEPVTPTLDN